MSKKKGWHKGRGKPGPTRPEKQMAVTSIPAVFPPLPPRYSMESGSHLKLPPSVQIRMAERQIGNGPRAADMTGDQVLERIDRIFRQDARAEMVFGTLSGMLSQALGYDVDRFQVIVRKEPRAEAPMVRVTWNREEQTK